MSVLTILEKFKERRLTVILRKCDDLIKDAK